MQDFRESVNEGDSTRPHLHTVAFTKVKRRFTTRKSLRL